MPLGRVVVPLGRVVDPLGRVLLPGRVLVVPLGLVYCGREPVVAVPVGRVLDVGLVDEPGRVAVLPGRVLLAVVPALEGRVPLTDAGRVLLELFVVFALVGRVFVAPFDPPLASSANVADPA